MRTVGLQSMSLEGHFVNKSCCLVLLNFIDGVDDSIYPSCSLR
jgi:hypothetical protein